MPDPAAASDRTAEAEPSDGRLRRGRRTRMSILREAADLASVEGLEGLTIGRLSAELGMSKSGLFAHFGSKEELQLATNAAAIERFREAVVDPALALPPGGERLRALVGGWLDYLRRGVFRGGCYFAAVRAEFDARPPGPVRDAILGDHQRWVALLTRTVREAREAGDLPAGTDDDVLALELESLCVYAGLRFQLERDPVVFDRAAAAVRARIGG